MSSGLCHLAQMGFAFHFLTSGPFFLFWKDIGVLC